MSNPLSQGVAMPISHVGSNISRIPYCGEWSKCANLGSNLPRWARGESPPLQHDVGNYTVHELDRGVSVPTILGVHRVHHIYTLTMRRD
jgi:hypothetical protein